MTENTQTWLSDVVATLSNLGGEAHYDDIYQEAEKVRKDRNAPWPKSAKAIIRRTLEEQSSDTKSFKGEDLFYSVQGIGSGVWGLRSLPKTSSTYGHNFEPGELYSRRKDIHRRFGGSYQGGICPSKDHPFIFLFTGSVGEQFGYSDGWNEDGVFDYIGEGQIGDMVFNKGNKAIRDHVSDGRDLLLFQQRGKGKSYRFMGQFVCIGYEIKEIPDKDLNIRKGIVFQLKNVDEEIEYSKVTINDQPKQDIKQLREKAYSAVRNTKEAKSRDSKRMYFERNRDIKEYVLSRAGGICECCGQPAPFLKKDGSPYLEPHHIYKLSDKGLDHPRMIAAITPNCHRQIHYGINGSDIDKKLEKIIKDKEASFERTNSA